VRQSQRQQGFGQRNTDSGEERLSVVPAADGSGAIVLWPAVVSVHYFVCHLSGNQTAATTWRPL
jgi:hypothetical protein